jgi:hypothetical protein
MTPITFRAIVNGMGATAILDSGAEVDMVSPDFLENCRSPEVYRLKVPLDLGMAISGSATSVNYGAYLSVAIDSVFIRRHYFDVQKCNKCDLILGVPFMLRHHINTALHEGRSFTIGNLKFPDRFGLQCGPVNVSKGHNGPRSPYRGKSARNIQQPCTSSQSRNSSQPNTVDRQVSFSRKKLPDPTKSTKEGQ